RSRYSDFLRHALLQVFGSTFQMQQASRSSFQRDPFFAFWLLELGKETAWFQTGPMNASQSCCDQNTHVKTLLSSIILSAAPELWNLAPTFSRHTAATAEHELNLAFHYAAELRGWAR